MAPPSLFSASHFNSIPNYRLNRLSSDKKIVALHLNARLKRRPATRSDVKVHIHVGSAVADLTVGFVVWQQQISVKAILINVKYFMVIEIFKTKVNLCFGNVYKLFTCKRSKFFVENLLLHKNDLLDHFSIHNCRFLTFCLLFAEDIVDPILNKNLFHLNAINPEKSTVWSSYIFSKFFLWKKRSVAKCAIGPTLCTLWPNGNRSM